MLNDKVKVITVTSDIELEERLAKLLAGDLVKIISITPLGNYEDSTIGVMGRKQKFKNFLIIYNYLGKPIDF